jgi:hypothetical protein
MAVVITPVGPDEGTNTFQALKNRNMGLLIGTLAFDSSYQVGGEDITAQLAKYFQYAWMVVPPWEGFTFQHIPGSNLLKVYAGGGGFEAFSYSDIKGSGNTDAETADLGAGVDPTNYGLISTEVTQTVLRAAAGVLVIAAQLDIPRNVGITIQNDSGGDLNLYVGTTNFTVVGTFLGAPQTETISFTNLDATKVVAGVGHTHCRVKYGVKPFSQITSITEGVVGADVAGNLKIAACPGSLIGLPGRIAANADVLQLSKNAAALATAGIVSYTNSTVNFGTLADGDDVAGTFRSSGECPAAFDLSALTAVPFFAFGY